ncbi:MAG TPA: FapA family protein [Chthonomonadaceae bacterium]|nr:FapA family protein [Chthonomonadaceae bacterium]
MAQGINRNGSMELKFNEDRTQALLTIHPAMGDGDAVTLEEVLGRLKKMGVSYGIRELAIVEAIRFAQEKATSCLDKVVAQGVLPEDGKDAKVSFTLPLEVLTKPLPKRTDEKNLIDWFSLDPEKMVKADQELAAIVPAQPGSPGKTLTWPVQSVVYRQGKSAAVSIGEGVRAVEGGLRLLANQDGYVCLHGELLTVYALQQIENHVTGGSNLYPAGVVFLGNVQNTQIWAGNFVSVRGRVTDCRIRAQGDVYLRSAENTEIITPGEVYFTEYVKNCLINTRKRALAIQGAHIVGGSVWATEGIRAFNVGTPDFTETELQVGVDRLSEVRMQEIQEELVACDMNIKRISQALKPFVTLAAHAALTEDKRQLLQKLQAQQRSQEVRIRELHNERRSLAIAMKERVNSTISVEHCVYPGVWIGVGGAAVQIESPLENVRFMEASGGKSIQTEPLKRAA